MGVNYICFTSGTSYNCVLVRGRCVSASRCSFYIVTNTEYMSIHENLHFPPQQDVESSPEEPQRGGQFRSRVRAGFGTWDRSVRVYRDQQINSWVRNFIFIVIRIMIVIIATIIITSVDCSLVCRQIMKWPKNDWGFVVLNSFIFVKLITFALNKVRNTNRAFQEKHSVLSGEFLCITESIHVFQKNLHFELRKRFETSGM